MAQPATLRAAARGLLALKKAQPKSRAAKLITADDEKRLRAIVKLVDAPPRAFETGRQERAGVPSCVAHSARLRACLPHAVRRTLGGDARAIPLAVD